MTPPKHAVDRPYIDAFRENCTDRRLAAMVLFMFQTGARVGDAIHLEPEDVDLVGRKAMIRDMKNGDDGEADLTFEMVYELHQLAEWKEARAKADDYGRGARGRRHPNTRVFGFRHRWAVYKEVRAVCLRAGIPYLGTHQPGRHSFATEMIVKHGVDVATTAHKGRWKSKALLMTNYAHAEVGSRVIDRVFGHVILERHPPGADRDVEFLQPPST